MFHLMSGGISTFQFFQRDRYAHMGHRSLILVLEICDTRFRRGEPPPRKHIKVPVTFRPEVVPSFSAQFMSRAMLRCRGR